MTIKERENEIRDHKENIKHCEEKMTILKANMMYHMEMMDYHELQINNQLKKQSKS